MKLISLFIFIISVQLGSSFILDVMNNVNTVVSFVDVIKNILGIATPKEPTPEEIMNEKLDNLLDSIEDIAERMEKIAESSDAKLDDIKNQLEDMQHMQKVTKAQDELAEYINRIDELYDEFIAYSDDRDSFNKDTIEEFIKVITSHDNLALGNALNRMHALFIPKRSSSVRGSILNMILGIQKLKKNDFSCDNPLSIQQFILDLYEQVAISELRGFLIVSFAYSVLSVFNGASYQKELDKASAQATIRSIEYLNSTKSAMEVALTEYKRCNPDDWEVDSNYFELKQLYQGFLIGEIEGGNVCDKINTDKPKFCHRYQISHKHSTGPPHMGGRTYTTWEDKSKCWEQICRGYVSQCVLVGKPTVCEKPDRSPERYTYIKNEKEQEWGDKKNCEESSSKEMPTEMESRKNNVCLCECAEEQKLSRATRTFSLQPVVSDVDQNKVITGVRISNANQMIRLEVEQGELITYGRVDEGSVDWVPSVEYEYDSRHQFGAWLYPRDKGKMKFLTLEKDFTFFWAKQKTLNLDKLTAPKNYVITGVKFVHDPPDKTIPIDERSKDPLQLSIQITPINFTEGKLIPTDKNPSKWITSDQVENKSREYSKKRTELKIVKATNPLDAIKPNERDSTPNQFVNFHMSDAKADIGTYTIPFFDMQEVSPVKKVPLVGIEIFHKGTKGYGGFLALQISHINYAQYIQTVLDTDKVAVFKNLTSSIETDKSSQHKARG